jgi:ASCH domain-containing protein
MINKADAISMGLVVRSPWVEKILSGEKTWEIRSKPNSTTGRIALCKGGGPIVGTCIIGRSIPLSREEFRKNFDKHRVSEQQLVEFYGDRQVYAWPVSDARPLSEPIRYKHPGGGSWVTLSPQNVSEFDRLQSL